MYVVTFKETPNSLPLVVHGPFVDGIKLVSGNINQGVNNIDSFDLEIDFSNAGYNHMKPMQTLVEVRNIKNNRIEFSGRLLNYTDNMTSDGLHSKAAVCEGVLGYLHDSHQPYGDFSGTPEDLFKSLIFEHNKQVELYKRFELGVISLKTRIDKDGTILSVNNNLTISNLSYFITPENTTFENITSALLDVYGGEIQVRNVGSLSYIDYVQSIGHDSLEDITISRNLRSVTKKVDPSSIVTRLIPLGKTISTPSQTDNERRVTIESVNDGVMYLDRSDLISAFGIQTGSVIYDDVENPVIIKQAGIDWLNGQKIILQQFTVEAIDLFKIGKGIEEYNVGNTHNVINPIMTLNERIRIVTKKVDIVDPINSTLTIGDKFKTLIDYQKEQRDASKNYSKLNNVVTQQGTRLSSSDGRISNLEGVISENVYYDGITYEKLRDTTTGTDYWVTTIPHTDENGNLIALKHGFPNDSFNTGEEIPRNFAIRHVTSFCSNASVVDANEKLRGLQITDGVINQEDSVNPTESYTLGIKADNTLKAYPAHTSGQILLDDGVVNAVTAWYPIIENGSIVDTNIWTPNQGSFERHPRQIIAQMPDKSIKFFTFEGRNEDDAGVTLQEAANVLLPHGVTFAYNLDGGGSAQPIVRGTLLTVSDATGDTSERATWDFIYVKRESQNTQNISVLIKDIGDANKRSLDVERRLDRLIHKLNL